MIRSSVGVVPFQEKPPLLIAFDDMTRPVALEGCDDIAPVLSSILYGWSFREVHPDHAPAPAITIRKTDYGYSRTSEWLKKPSVYTDVLNAACDFLVCAFKCYIADNPSFMCLHTAALEIGDGLILFPSTYKAGKSMLSAQLAALGGRLYGDDVLYIPGGGELIGMAPGILPRLRLPLPDDAGPRLDNFIRSRRGPENDRFLYLGMNEGELASYGETAPIKAIIELKRKPGAEISLQKARTGDILKKTILQNFSEAVPALDVLDRLHGLVENTDSFTLRYSDGAAAARALIDRFS